MPLNEYTKPNQIQIVDCIPIKVNEISTLDNTEGVDMPLNKQTK